MDKVLAARMAAEIVGAQVGGWYATELLGSGKSALVLRAEKEGVTAALKVFDPDLIEKYGETSQLGRIEREKRLVGKTHPHLVRIFDGGKCSLTGRLFVAMECVPAKDLSQLLTEVPRDRIRPLIAQLALAAQFLEEQELAHRDIKPSNIAVSDDFVRLTLLDLGVLRPFGETGLTDTEGQQFVGTLQYSSPEFLFRTEQDTLDGWRALTFYQIGAVLYDLIKRKPLFEEFSVPYARMVEAVKYETPDFNVPGADVDLVSLAQSCLVKDPALRLRLVTWDSFKVSQPPVSVTTIKDRVKRLQAGASTDIAPSELNSSNLRLALNTLLSVTSTMIREECSSNKDVFPQYEVHDEPTGDVDSAAFRVAFPKSTGKGVPVAFAILFRIRLLDVGANIVEISGSGAVSGDVRRFPPEKFSPPTVLYCGPFAEQTIRTQVAYSLYAAMEAVFVHPAVGLDDVFSLTIKMPENVE